MHAFPGRQGSGLSENMVATGAFHYRLFTIKSVHGENDQTRLLYP